ncbi:iron transporter [Flavobacteriaceae bacterium]|nr:iron transporter [Flavobacteriaceae bacterium]
MKNYILSVVSILTFTLYSSAQELIIGEERIEPGLIFIFEGAIKDHVSPNSMHLKENQTNVHIEARVNWDTKNIPKGSPEGGFIPYLHITAQIINEKTGLSTFIDLLAHINLIDNFHYARNISLPGKINDLYSVKFSVIPPTNIELALHNDWNKTYGKVLFSESSFTYKNVDFEEIAKASRK